jgi:hypothetical protein
MLKKMISTTVAVFIATLISGCVISIEKDHCTRHPDRCYDCHYSWELDKLSAEATCREYEITLVADGYWYKPAGADDTVKQFHLLKAHHAGTVLGPGSP